MSRYSFAVNTLSFGQVHAKLSHPDPEFKILKKERLEVNETLFIRNSPDHDTRAIAWDLYRVSYSGYEVNPPAKPVPFTAKAEVNKAIDEMVVQLDIQINGMDAFRAQLSSLKSAYAVKLQGKPQHELAETDPLKAEGARISAWLDSSGYSAQLHCTLSNQRDMLLWIQKENNKRA